MRKRIGGWKGYYTLLQGRLRSLVEGNEACLLAILLLVVSCTAGVVLYDVAKHSFLYFGDAASHIVKARQFFDSQRPGFHNIGTVWLPLPHVILVPFVAFDSLFYSGIAGPIVGIPCLVATGFLLFLMVRRITDSPAIAFLSGCLFGLNPNVVYMALTPMNESLLMFLVTFGGYAFLRWLLDDGERWLWICAAAVALASLCRYEAWFLVSFVSFVSGLQGIFLWRRGERSAALRFLTICGICWAGIAFWICWNYFEYGDPLKFARWTYAVAPGRVLGNERQSPLDALLIFAKALLVIFGPVVLLTAAGAFIRSKRTSLNQAHLSLLLLFFGLPAIFALMAILAGFVQIDQWRWNWRYVLTASLFLAVAGGMGLAEYCRRVPSTFARGLVVTCLCAMPLVQIAIPSVGVATFQDAQRSMSDNTRFAMTLGGELHTIYQEGSIVLLTGYSQAQRIMLASELPLKRFNIIYNPSEEDILGSLQDSERYLVIGKDGSAGSERFVNAWLSRRDELLHYYEIRFENDHHILMERKPGFASRGIRLKESEH